MPQDGLILQYVWYHVQSWIRHAFHWLCKSAKELVWPSRPAIMRKVQRLDRLCRLCLSWTSLVCDCLGHVSHWLVSHTSAHTSQRCVEMARIVVCPPALLQCHHSVDWSWQSLLWWGWQRFCASCETVGMFRLCVVEAAGAYASQWKKPRELGTHNSDDVISFSVLSQGKCGQTKRSAPSSKIGNNYSLTWTDGKSHFFCCKFEEWECDDTGVVHVMSWLEQ